MNDYARMTFSYVPPRRRPVIPDSTMVDIALS